MEEKKGIRPYETFKTLLTNHNNYLSLRRRKDICKTKEKKQTGEVTIQIDRKKRNALSQISRANSTLRTNSTNDNNT